MLRFVRTHKPHAVSNFVAQKLLIQSPLRAHAPLQTRLRRGALR